jgi:hypothetical protein
MEKVFSVDGLILMPLKGGEPLGENHPVPSGTGVIEEIINPGRYIVSLESGEKVMVNGPARLKVGDGVKVLISQISPEKKMTSASTANPLIDSEKGFQWSAFIPLAFGGQGSLARIEAFVEKRNKNTREKETPAAFFIFTLRTGKKGEIQWSVYLRGRQVALQVYIAVLNELKRGYQDMVREVEANLKQHGFVLAVPTVFLNRPFKVPPGFRLNVRG